MKSTFQKCITSLLLMAAITAPVCAKEMQKLSLKKGFVYLLVFDQKIEEYKVGSSDLVKVELINTIMNDKKQMAITPLSQNNTNIIVWTKDRLYNLDICIDNNKANNDKIIRFNSTEPELKKKLGNLQLDIPPITPQKEIFKFELDAPPSIN